MTLPIPISNDPTTTPTNQTHPRQPHHSQHTPTPSKHNQQQQQPPPSETEKREATSAFTASLHSLGANYTAELVDRAKLLHGNSAALSRQEEQVAKSTNELRKQNEAWGRVVDEAGDALKELGDLQNWAEVLEREFLVLEETVRLADEKEEGEEEEGGRKGGLGRGDAEEVLAQVGRDVEGTTRDGDGKVNEEEGGKGKGKGTESGTVKKGWFAWW
ncbi:hypothetical protein BJX61DRAFT_549578 [Aspergillus egyptiacus]|nr:hypothetical protein BJX61DRAFT_549578 [Aspergillus egyptiacus]